MHQRGQAELAQQRAVDPEAARLAHGQDRHVHHVRERVVVVVLQRRQRQQRGAVLRDRLRQRIDHAARSVRVGHPLDSRAVPQRLRHLDRIVVQPRNVAMSPTLASVCSSTCRRPTRMCGSRGQRRRLVARVGSRHGLDEPDDLVALHAAVDDDALDAGLLQPPHQLAHRRRRRADRHVADDEVVADDADRDRGHGLRVRAGERFGERGDVACDERMIRRVELRAAERGREATQRARRRVGRVRSRSRRLSLSARSAVPTCAFASFAHAAGALRRRLLEHRRALRAIRCASAPPPPHGAAPRF